MCNQIQRVIERAKRQDNPDRLMLGESDATGGTCVYHPGDDATPFGAHGLSAELDAVNCAIYFDE